MMVLSGPHSAGQGLACQTSTSVARMHGERQTAHLPVRALAVHDDDAFFVLQATGLYKRGFAYQPKLSNRNQADYTSAGRPC